MTDKTMQKTRAGRPTAEQALRKALEPFKATGFDHHLIADGGLNIMAMLAVDPSVPPETRLTAAIALHDRRFGPGKCVNLTDSKPGPAMAPADPGIPGDEITRRALEIARRGTSR